MRNKASRWNESAGKCKWIKQKVRISFLAGPNFLFYFSAFSASASVLDLAVQPCEWLLSEQNSQLGQAASGSPEPGFSTPQQLHCRKATPLLNRAGWGGGRKGRGWPRISVEREKLVQQSQVGHRIPEGREE